MCIYICIHSLYLYLCCGDWTFLPGRSIDDTLHLEHFNVEVSVSVKAPEHWQTHHNSRCLPHTVGPGNTN